MQQHMAYCRAAGRAVTIHNTVHQFSVAVARGDLKTAESELAFLENCVASMRAETSVSDDVSEAA
jgi:hypothetical protein